MTRKTRTTSDTDATPQAGSADAVDDQLEPLITECPSCLTRFRVSLIQLQRARGKVRCGACLAVFNGIEHLTMESAQLYPDDDQARQALDEVLDELAGDAGGEPRAAPARLETGAPEPPRNLPRAPIFSGYEDDDAGEADDHSDAAADSDADADAADLDAGAEPVDGATEHSAADHGAAADITAPAPPEAPAEPDVDYSFEVIGDRDVPQQAQPATAAAATPAPAGPGETVPARDSQQPSRPVATVATVAPARPFEAEAEAPVQFGEDTARRPLLWGGIAVGVLLLGVQVLWYQFDDWGKEPGWRAVYAPLCAVVGCELPEQRDITLLATRNLAVRSDPQRPGTLLVNAIIVNDADYAQPFPVLELRFTTVRGMLVAGRRFQPDEYLAGDAVGMRLIPPKTPVQIELGIDDPGPEAVNYFLRFL